MSDGYILTVVLMLMVVPAALLAVLTPKRATQLKLRHAVIVIAFWLLSAWVLLEWKW